MNKLDHFYQMEANYQTVTDEIHAFHQSLNNFDQQVEKIQMLSDYYGSTEWFDHIDMRQAGEIPEDATSGVLGEDLAYELLLDVKEMAIQMLEISTKLLK